MTLGSGSAWVLPGNLAVQLVDGVVLRGDDPVHEIPDGNDAQHFFIFYLWVS